MNIHLYRVMGIKNNKRTVKFVESENAFDAGIKSKLDISKLISIKIVDVKYMNEIYDSYMSFLIHK